jgi:hypothetical protein
MPIVIKGREPTVIPDGAHPAKIREIKVEKRGKEAFEYLDVHVELTDVTGKEGKHPVIKTGMPFDLSPMTKLGRLLLLFGVSESEIKSGNPIDLEKVLKVGMPVKVVTTMTETDKGSFAEIASLKPA